MTGSDGRRSGRRRRVRAVTTRLLLRVILGAAVVVRRWWDGDVGRSGASELPMGGEGAYNGRVLLEYAVKELRADGQPDPCEVGLAVTATADVLDALGKASAGLGVAPPEARHLRRWADALLERASRAPGGRSG